MGRQCLSEGDNFQHISFEAFFMGMATPVKLYLGHLKIFCNTKRLSFGPIKQSNSFFEVTSNDMKNEKKYKAFLA